MKKTIISIVAVCALLIAGVAMAENIDRTLDADRDARISISNLAGEVEVRGWDESRVHVGGTIGDDVEELIFERDGRNVTIKVKIPERSRGRKDVTSHLEIRVPAGSSLNVSTVSANVIVKDVRGEQELQSVSGEISTEAFGAEIDAEAVSGNVVVKGDGSGGVWRLATVSGDVRALNLSGEINATVVSGNIEVDRGTYERVRLETVNGRIEFTGGLSGGGKMDLESVNGSVDVNFVGDVSARFDIETFNGGIRNCFGPKPARTSRHAPGWELSFTEGGGDGQVTIDTLNGRVKLCKG